MAILSYMLYVLLLGSNALAQKDGEIRLVNGDTYLEGRVEIFHNGQWGTICDDRFGYPEGQVICRSLGYGTLNTAFSQATYGQGTGQIWMDELACSGDEEALTECSFNGWGVHDCRHYEDAGVKCNPKPVEVVRYNISELPLRISCPPDSATCNACPSPVHDQCMIQSVVKGILEAHYEGKWYPVNGEGWGVEEARVACGQLGYSASWTPPSLDQLWKDWNASSNCTNTSGCDEFEDYRDHLKIVFLKDPICTGYEQTLLNCSLASVDVHNLSGDPLHTKSVATIECGNRPPRTEECYTSSFEVYRLRAGPLPWTGRVEVRVAGSWKTVCDDGWGVTEANLVCRALGYGTAKSIHGRAHFGRGSGDVGYAGLQCPDHATSLDMCTKSSEVPASCDEHAGDAGVVCYHPQPDEICPNTGPYSRLRDVTYPDTDGRPLTRPLLEIKHNNVWGRLCYEAVDIHVANTACRESRGMFINSFEKASPPDDHLYVGLRFNGSIVCQGEETSINQCLSRLTGSYKPCARGYVALYCIQGIPDLVPSLEDFRRSLYYAPYVNIRPMYSLTCAKEDECLASSADTADPNDYRSLLRFDSLTMNLGTRTFLPPGNSDTWIWHNCHRHYHSYESFIHYDLLDSVTKKQVAEGHKASFCLEDSVCLPNQYSTFSCLLGTQGISVNCGDFYGYYLDCQWIDVTGVPTGEYIIQQEVNPKRYAVESDYRNNVISCSISYHYFYSTFQYFIVRNCTHSDH